MCSCKNQEVLEHRMNSGKIGRWCLNSHLIERMNLGKTPKFVCAKKSNLVAFVAVVVCSTCLMALGNGALMMNDEVLNQSTKTEYNEKLEVPLASNNTIFRKRYVHFLVPHINYCGKLKQNVQINKILV